MLRLICERIGCQHFPLSGNFLGRQENSDLVMVSLVDCKRASGLNCQSSAWMSTHVKLNGPE